MGKAKLDLKAQVYENLTVLEEASPEGKHTRWLCRCSCGKELIVRTNNLRTGHTKSCGCVKGGPPIIDETGNRYGSLLVLSINKDKKRTAWNCSCDCGNNVVVFSENLRSGNTKSCGCLQKIKARDANRKKEGEALLTTIINKYKLGARRRKHNWNLTREQVEILCNSNCHYCGSEPKRRLNRPDLFGELYYNGIDRKDNSIGYEPDNVLPCCTACNLAKHTMSYDDFLNWAERVYLNHKNLDKTS